MFLPFPCRLPCSYIQSSSMLYNPSQGIRSCCAPSVYTVYNPIFFVSLPNVPNSIK